MYTVYSLYYQGPSILEGTFPKNTLQRESSLYQTLPTQFIVVPTTINCGFKFSTINFHYLSFTIQQQVRKTF